MPSGSAAVGGPLLSYADMVDRVAPAVVTIRSMARVRAPRQFPFFDDPFFREFFGGNPQGGGSDVEERSSLGSGVIVRADGYILTNHHVIDGAQQIKVDLSSNKTYSATVVGSDPPSDLAVLKISTSGLPVLQPGDSDQVRVGDVCLALGNPLGVGETVTAGIISAKGRQTELSSGSYQNFLQTDAPINRGNSGGALVNTRGELIGINTAILSPGGEQGGNIGIGFAIPSNMAKNVMQQLIAKGQVRRGMLGVGIQNATTDIASSFGLKERTGIIITSVTPGGPADKAGLKDNDIILKMNGKDETVTSDLRNQVAAMAPGTEVTLLIWRNNAEQQVKVKLGEMTQESASATPGQGGGNQPAGRLGLTVQTISPSIARQLRVPAGTPGVVVTEVDPAGPAAEAGVQAGDIITQVNRQPVRSPADVTSALQRSTRSTLLLLNRGGQNFYISVQ
jgi:serine protease Do